jgi:hypothetical protein
LTYDCSPLEYSWKWNTSEGEPDIRYSWEPFNPGHGTSDPLNHALSTDYMQAVKDLFPGTDFTLATHFLAEIERGDRVPAPFLQATEFHRRKNWGFKSYFFPRNAGWLRAGDSSTLGEWLQAIGKLNANNASRDLLVNFLENDANGQVMIPA